MANSGVHRDGEGSVKKRWRCCSLLFLSVLVRLCRLADVWFWLLCPVGAVLHFVLFC